MNNLLAHDFIAKEGILSIVGGICVEDEQGHR